MHKSTFSHHQQRTGAGWWIGAVILTIITVAVIIAGIIIFVGYLIVHPRVPTISVVGAHLDQFQYYPAGVLVTQLTIVLRSDNQNAKAHASFSDLILALYFDGIRIAILVSPPYNVRKNDSVDFNYEVTSKPIPLDPQQMQNVDESLNEDLVRFDLKGRVKARWRVGILGSFKFNCHLSCQLRFRRSDQSYLPRTCTSRSK